MIQQFILKVLRRVYSKCFIHSKPDKPESIKDANQASELIYKTLMNDAPSMIARFGNNELVTVINYLGVSRYKNNYFSFIMSKTPSWWWEESIGFQMNVCAGFFPVNDNTLERFSKLMLKEIPKVDILGSWLPEELYFNDLLKKSSKVDLELLNPYFSDIPWTRALEGKKVLVVHPFAETIESQYKKRNFLFSNNLLPEFELKTVKAVQGIAGNETGFNNWFEALDYMKTEIDKIDYDICLIGCGAYGFPLAAYVKDNGKKGFHIGGSLQLLFGIRGKRWESEDYNPIYNYSQFINEYWVKPDDKDKPKNADIVEGACYW